MIFCSAWTAYGRAAVLAVDRAGVEVHVDEALLVRRARCRRWRRGRAPRRAIGGSDAGAGWMSAAACVVVVGGVVVVVRRTVDDARGVGAASACAGGVVSSRASAPTDAGDRRRAPTDRAERHPDPGRAGSAAAAWVVRGRREDAIVRDAKQLLGQSSILT